MMIELWVDAECPTCCTEENVEPVESEWGGRYRFQCDECGQTFRRDV